MNTPTVEKIKPESLARLIERIEKIYKKFAPGLFKHRTEVGYISAFDSMIERYLRHRFDDYSDLADFTHAALFSDLQPRDRYYICCAIEDLLIELELQDISHDDLHRALFAPIWRIEDAREERRRAK